MTGPAVLSTPRPSGRVVQLGPKPSGVHVFQGRTAIQLNRASRGVGMIDQDRSADPLSITTLLPQKPGEFDCQR
jgi:hypothetical protein